MDVVVFQINSTSNLALVDVVVGSATVLASNDVPQEIARGVALSVMAMCRCWPGTGVPVRPEVIDVIA